MLFSQQDIESQFTSSVVRRGQEITTTEQITHFNVQRGGEVITAKVSAADDDSYRVYIRIHKDAGKWSFQGECACSERSNCGHVVAVLLFTVDGGNSASTRAITTSNQSLSKPELMPQNNTQTPQALLYILHADFPAVSIETVVARRLQQGGFGEAYYYDPAKLSTRNPARYLIPLDIDLLTNIQEFNNQNGIDAIRTKGRQSLQLLESVLSTGRCYFQSALNNDPLKVTVARQLQLQWVMDKAGTQELQWQIVPQAELILCQCAPWYVDIHTSECGLLSCQELPDHVTYDLLTLPAIAMQDAEKTNQRLRTEYPDINLPLLQVLEIVALPKVEPTPCLTLTTMSKQHSKDNFEYFNCVALSFDYSGVMLNRHAAPTYYNGRQLLQVSRSQSVEHEAVNQLRTMGFDEANDSISLSGEDCFFLSDAVEDWAEFQMVDVPLLRKAGWQIITDASFRASIIEPQSWYCEAHNSDDRDWFDFTLGVEIDGQKINILPAMVELIRKYPRGLPQDEVNTFILTLEDGRLLPVSLQRLNPMYNTLLELYATAALQSDQELHLRRAQIAQLTELERLSENQPFQWLGDGNIKQLVERLRNVESIVAIKAPEDFAAQLRPYQQRGLDWLQFLRENQLAGILADDMGLGKTVQVLAHLLVEKQQARMRHPCLVIAPTSLIFNWRNEARRFCPQLKVLTLHGADRHAKFGIINQHDIVVTSYPLLIRDQEHLLQHFYHVLVLDEAQMIKNTTTQVSRIARQLQANHKLCLTGTPMENHLAELWGLFDFLLPGYLGTSQQFTRIYRTPIEKSEDDTAAIRLAQRVRPFLLRRLKEDVASDLPPKTEIIHSVRLEEEQRELYETVRLAMHSRVIEEIQRQGIARSQIIILDALLKLRQVCCDPRIVKMENAQHVKQSAKLEALMDLLPEMIEEDRRVLVFSQFTSMLSLIEGEAQKMHIPYAKLTGQTRDREQVVSLFQQGKSPLFLISLKAGGVGLNLTAADTVIHYDPWWNPAVERQATDRAHRIGQQKPVFVYKLLCEGTVEEKIHGMQQRKQALANSIYNGTQNSEPQWSEDDMEQLFSPIN